MNAIQQSFTPFSFIPDFNYESGWDKYALKYATLLQPDTLYYLHKQVMYDYMDKYIIPRFGGKPLNILDVNCGTGNDFPYLLSKGTVTGTDGSAGMLNKAAEIYAPAVQANKLSLYRGLLQDMDEQSLEGRKFDIIYSITGGFSYISDEDFIKSFKVLKTMLQPGGVMVTAHLNTFCLSETIGCIAKRKFRRSIIRLKKNIPTDDGGTMYLRNKGMLHKLLSPVFSNISFFPLICVAPPYQTGVQLSPKALRKFRNIEGFMAKKAIGYFTADQVVVVCS